MVAQTIPEDRPLTADDFMSLPMENDHLYELLQGELVFSPSPEIMHQRISRRLVVRLDTDPKAVISVKYFMHLPQWCFRRTMSSSPICL
jgi:hypothetical protein